MNATELRINNLVDTGNFEIEMVTSIHPGVIECTHSTIPAKYVEPVELTDEWLVNFGFTETGEPDVWSLDGFEIDTVYDSKGKFIGYGFPLNGVIEDLWIKYVHQLQNLYFALYQKEMKLIMKT